MNQTKKSACFFVTVIMVLLFGAKAQDNILVKKDPIHQKVSISIGNKLFTEFIYADSIEKPFLYPIYASNGESITRGFPWNPQPNDPTDHPHHIGLWFNYESVNGLDFWNNSYNIPVEKKKQYGWIRTEKIAQIESGQKGKLVYLANWTDQQKNILLQEKTTFIFSSSKGNRIIDRITELMAIQDVTMPDVKDGMLGLRVAHELELPVKQTKEYKDDKGIVTKVTATKDEMVTGNYLTSEGKQGEAAWGTRGNWCMLYGKKGKDSISIVIIDHPENPGYPTYWHARNYGLFAANPLGQKVFSEGKQTLNFKLAKGQSTAFRYRVVIAAGNEKLDRSSLNQFVSSFTTKK